MDAVDEIVDKHFEHHGHHHGVRTVTDWLCDCVNFDIPENVAIDILVDREIDPTLPVMEVEKKGRDLSRADLYMWICTSPTRKGDDSDSDNSWAHKVGGYTLSDADKDRLMKLAKAIYAQYEEPKVLPSSIRLHSYGIRKSSLIK